MNLRPIRKYLRSIALLVLSGATAWAHDPGLSTTQVTFQPDGIEIVVGYAPADLRALLGPGAKNSPEWTAADFAAAQPQLHRLAPQLWKLSSGGAALAPDVIREELTAGNTVSFQLHYAPPASGKITLESGVMDRLPPGHRDFLSAAGKGGAVTLEKLVDAQTGPIELK